MAENRPFSADRLPTLTDVLQTVDKPTAASTVEDQRPHSADDSELAAELLESIQERIDTLFQARLREAIAPSLARAVDGLLRELGPELACALRETAERAVAQELARRRKAL
jgi:hypothetical protein